MIPRPPSSTRTATLFPSAPLFRSLPRGRVAAPFRAVGGWGLLLAVVFAAGTFFFILALSLTAVADVLVIVAAAPLAAAVLSLAFLGEGVPLRTWVAISLRSEGRRVGKECVSTCRLPW